MVDFHFHVEEGPYTFRWLERTAKALQVEKGTTKESFERAMEALRLRLEQGCYSEQWLDRYLTVAKERGLTEVGIVDHLYRFREMRSYFENVLDLTSPSLGSMQKTWLHSVMSESIEQYIEGVRRVQAKWEKEGVTLRLGIEADYFPEQEEELRQFLKRYPFDFVIGSIHFWRGWGFDNPETQGRFETLDLSVVYDEVATTIEQAARSELFSFIAHVDNLKVFGHRPQSSILHSFYERVAQVLAQHDVASEWNAGLYYRYPVREACPSDALLDYFARYEVPLTLSSDAHFPDDLGRHVEDGKRALQRAGYSSVATFAEGKRIMKNI